LKLVVVGQGYVGLPLAVAAARAGNVVVGLDNNAKRVSLLSDGISPVEDIADGDVAALISAGTYSATTDSSTVSGADIVAICVPTPLGAGKKPDLSALKSSVESVASHLSAGTLVIIESTVEPGTTRDFVLPLLLAGSGLKESDIDLAFSPERIDPANKKYTITNTPKLVAGLTDRAVDRAVAFYSGFVTDVTRCSTLEVAETAKLLENSFRLINISFINEIAQMCDVMGVDVNEVISAASTKPYGFMPFFPSAGIGGHCIPIDPIYLSHKAKSVGAPSSFIDLAQKINDERPGYFVSQASSLLGGLGGKKVVVVGVAYKPNVSDVRESAAEALVDGLRTAGAVVSWHDELVEEWRGETSVALSSSFDLAILVNVHEGTDLSALGSVPMINTKGGVA
jgi:UDP-N-acetyl-D-glucosamine dehydrogenase